MPKDRKGKYDLSDDHDECDHYSHTDFEVDLILEGLELTISDMEEEFALASTFQEEGASYEDIDVLQHRLRRAKELRDSLTPIRIHTESLNEEEFEILNKIREGKVKVIDV
jgi:hypothetical protein